jgi:hypothetical protein
LIILLNFLKSSFITYILIFNIMHDLNNLGSRELSYKMIEEEKQNTDLFKEEFKKM